jgi:uncharacterized protein YbcI
MMKGNKSKGMIEAEISEAIIKFEKEYMGRGPVETRTYIVDDMIIVRLKGVLTKAEEQLAKSEEGLILIKKVRVKLLEESRDLLKKIVTEIADASVKSIHTDISTVSGERVIIFTLEGNLEKKFAKNS